MTYDKDTISFEPIPTDPRFLNLTNRVFSQLTVLGCAGKQRNKYYWYCECDCGTIVKVQRGTLQTGRATSCGCACGRERHGEAGGKRSVEYRAFKTARNRCNSPSDRAYKNYGGRGIEFRFKSFLEFLEDLGRRPSSSHSLDRIDNNGHYEPGNVRWATRIEQNNNQRSNRYVEHDGKRLNIAQWATYLGASRSTFYQRLHQGWCEICTITTPRYGGICPHRDLVMDVIGVRNTTRRPDASAFEDSRDRVMA